MPMRGRDAGINRNLFGSEDGTLRIRRDALAFDVVVGPFGHRLPPFDFSPTSIRQRIASEGTRVLVRRPSRPVRTTTSDEDALFTDASPTLTLGRRIVQTPPFTTA